MIIGEEIDCKCLDIIVRVVKLSWNAWTNSINHRFGLGWIEMFLQIWVRVSFWIRGELDWLTNP